MDEYIVTLRLTHDFWEVFGKSSLLGMYGRQIVEDRASKEADRVILEIEETSYAYRKENGPESIIVPEFMPSCLIGDILKLASLGIKVEVKIIEIDSIK